MAASSKISASLLQILILWVSLASSDEDTSGGWQPASVEESMKYYTNICNIAKIPISEMTSERFEKEYRNTPFILTFPNGKKDWVQSDFWTVNNLSASYDQWQFTAGKSIDIVYSGGKGDTRTTFKEFVEEMRTKKVHGGDLTYLFDRHFYYNSTLPDTITLPEFLSNKGDSILFVGATGTGATFHKHMPAWNGVMFGQKRWFVYPVEQTPPGGMYSYTPAAWFEYVYPKLTPSQKPLECIQKAGEIFYVPESYYHAILNIGETVAISVQGFNVTTHFEAEFYAAMEDHFRATTVEDEKAIHAHFEASERRFVDLHFLLPGNTEILGHIADIACERGYTFRCERALNLQLSLDPYAINALKLRSRIYYDRQQYDLSEADVNTALKLNPVSKTLLRERANFLWNTKKSESKEAYERLLAVLDPDTTEAASIQNIIKMTDFGPQTASVKTDSETVLEADNVAEHNLEAEVTHSHTVDEL